MRIFHSEIQSREESRLDARFTLKGTTPQYAPDKTYETEHIRIEASVDLKRQTLKGVCRTRIRAITGDHHPMVFDAVNFKIKSVKWNGARNAFTYRTGKISIRPKKALQEGEKAEVEIAYQIDKPKMGLYFLKPERAYPKRPWQAWTQGEDEYARYWFPCHDTPGQRASTELVATVPAGFTAVSNGKLIKTHHDRKSKTSTFHWVQAIPHAPYLVTLAVGRFSALKDKWRKIPVTYYCEKGREEDARRAFGKTPQMLDFFSRSIGVDYPYAKYDQVAVSDFIYGGMENTSATTQTDTALLDKRASLDFSSDELVAHELAHQWFGDYLTCKDWSHAWLNESFATYFDALFKRHDKGRNEYLYQVHENAEEYFSEDKERYRRPIVTHEYQHPTDLFDRHLYEKGSVILYMIHQILGEKLFWKSINTYVKDNKGQTVETLDLIRALEKATGRNFKRFFDEWIFRAGHPSFKISSWWDQRKKTVSLRLTQSNADGGEKGLFTIDTEVLIKTRKSERRHKIQVNEKAHLFHWKTDGEPLMVVFDPDHQILKKTSFSRPESQAMYQLQHDKNPLGRIAAAQDLSGSASEKSLLALRDALLKDSFWGVQAEIAGALGKRNSEKAATILLNSLSVLENHKVRRAVYAALGKFKSEKIALEVGRKFRKEKSYFSEMNGLRAVGALRHPHAEEILKEALSEKHSWNHVIPIAALDGLGALQNEKDIPLFIKQTKWGVPHRVRMAAIRNLTRFGPGHNEIQTRLQELIFDPYLLVQVSAVQALQKCGDERAVPALKKVTTGDRDGRLMRLAKEAIKHLTKGFES